jgi:hypothetical protein
MSEDLRCCGTGTCIINSDGACWCGQRWDGEKMCFQKPLALVPEPHPESLRDTPKAMIKPD